MCTPIGAENGERIRDKLRRINESGAVMYD